MLRRHLLSQFVEQGMLQDDAVVGSLAAIDQYGETVGAVVAAEVGEIT